MKTPRIYVEWREDKHDREEDAAYSLAYHVIKRCRDEVIEQQARGKSADIKQIITDSVDSALCGFFDLAEGFFKLQSGNNRIELVMSVRVLDDKQNMLEEIDISPNKLDLPIGYWKWAYEKNFRSDA